MMCAVPAVNAGDTTRGTRAPVCVRRSLARLVSEVVIQKPWFTQPTLTAAGECWVGSIGVRHFGMLDADAMYR
jgi:hypothetical protein